jgi:S-adenosylmethionine decarboxylase proenzyme
LEVTVAGHKHLLYDLWLDDVYLLERVERWTEILLGVAERSGATVIGQQFHQFEPYGVTGFVLLAESHVSVHTWPEEGLAAIDIFTCGQMDADSILRWLRERLCPQRERLTTVERGGLE